MADLSRLKNRFGAPPSPEEVDELPPDRPQAVQESPPEPAKDRAAPATNAAKPKGRGQPVEEDDGEDEAAPLPRSRTRLLQPAPPTMRAIDGRSLLRTGRTIQFSTRVTASFDERLRRMAMERGVMLIEVLEMALDALDREDQS